MFQANGNFFNNAVSWLAEEKDLIAIAPRITAPRTVSLTESGGRLVFFYTLIILPLLVFHRRHRHLAVPEEAMSWKKIITLLLFLAILVAAIAYVNRREKGKLAVEGILLDFPAAAGRKRSNCCKTAKDSFFRSALPSGSWRSRWRPRPTRSALESILDNFCPLKYDRLVAENAREPESLRPGQARDRTEAVRRVDKSKPLHTIRLGMKNNLDSSSYAKLAAGGKVVSIASYKRNVLEKDLFAFRDKKFLEIRQPRRRAPCPIGTKARALTFFKKDDRWFMDKPVFSLAQEARVSEILSAAAMLEAKSFAGAVSTESDREFGLEKPLLTVEFRSASASRKIAIGKKGERYYAWVDGFNEICEIEQGFPGKIQPRRRLFP